MDGHLNPLAIEGLGRLLKLRILVLCPFVRGYTDYGYCMENTRSFGPAQDFEFICHIMWTSTYGIGKYKDNNSYMYSGGQKG